MRQCYTPEDLARSLKLTRKTIYRMIARGMIEAFRVRRCLRISSEEYNRVVSSGVKVRK